MLLTIVIPLLIIIIGFNLYVFLLGQKIHRLELKIIKLFQARTCQMVSIFQVTRNELVKPEQIFAEFFELKRREFSEDSFNISLENKFLTYKRIHNEINFIFKTCEQHRKLQLNPKYIYIRDGIIEKSHDIGKYMSLYNAINEKYSKLKDISRITLFGYLY